MAEGPVPANQSSQDKSSRQEEQEPVVVEPDVTCGHCKRELNNPYLLCCLHSVCKDCLPNLEVKDAHTTHNLCVHMYVGIYVGTVLILCTSVQNISTTNMRSLYV